MQLSLTNITYSYPDAPLPVIASTSVTFPRGWTGIIGDNGCGKSTLARIAARLIAPDSGTVSPRLFACYCPQDSSIAPAELEEFALDWGGDAERIRRVLGIADDWPWRYGTLSGGQQKRLQVACALWSRPDVLVMDEPTNDLDARTREALRAGLATFDGIGILISHDRALLDELAAQCLVFEGTGPSGARVRMRPGGYTKAMGLSADERMARLRERERAQHEVKRLEAEARRRQEEASRTAARRSARDLAKKDHDARARIGLAIVSGKDGVAGRLSATMERRAGRAREELDALRVDKRYDAALFDFGARARMDALAHLDAGELHAGEFSLGIPETWIGPADHVVLTGANGTGKSLLASAVMRCVHPGVRIACLPQEVDEAVRRQALETLATLDSQTKGGVLSIVGRLNSDPARLLAGDDASPGELRKLMLAQQLVDQPHLLVLDEPTNHLDAGSIEALEGLLAGFPGAFLLVTHDEALARAVGEVRWHTHEEAPLRARASTS